MVVQKKTITEDPGQSHHNQPQTGIMNAKLLETLSNDPKTTEEEIVQLLSFSETEQEQVERTTTKQWQCQEWYLHKTGFITASKCKRVFTCQETLDKNPAKNAEKLVEEITLVKSCPSPIQEERESQNAREWGLLHEDSARKAYQYVASHTHFKLKLVSKGFLISPSKPFLGVLVWTIFRNASALMVSL